MNLFKTYLTDIKNKITKHKKELNFDPKKDLNDFIVETPPEEFDFDFSSNVAMILAKRTKDNPKNIAEKIKNFLKKKSKDFSEISIAGPGFLNFKLTNKAWIKIIKDILKSNKSYGSEKNNKKFNIEFVSANPTGPMHVGHCRGAIFGDVLANLLKFNGNKVTKEFYVNDYGKQVDDFVRSVFFRMREINLERPFLMKTIYTQVNTLLILQIK